ncbi:hypothetical protein [Streptosporangium sp. NPDC049078]|uniref:hypothetical protein n=1 Tax=unclassified Streptosporangium TaxID=2632669 RepID=UPI00343805D2
MLTGRTKSLLTATMLGCALLLSGCGGGDADDPAPPTGAATQAPEPSGATCDQAADTVKNHLNSPDVTSVTVVGQCTLVVVETTLGDDDTTAARQLCERAGEVAYTGDINAISVKSRSDVEISNGITGMKCIP